MKNQTQLQSSILKLVQKRRSILPREGTRKLYKSLKPQLDQQQIKLGRDKLFDLLREQNMLIKPRGKHVVTTNSRHRFRIYKNLVKDFKPTAINQLWVSDITYLKTTNGFCYLALITDAYSRKIVGYDISNSLELEGALRALKKALRRLPGRVKPIHHSDRGIQYCSNQYTDLLKKNKLRISMASTGNCYENAMAERINGILKHEFYLNEVFINLKHAIKTTKDSIEIYNNKRLHMALGYQTPEKVHAKILLG